MTVFKPFFSPLILLIVIFVLTGAVFAQETQQVIFNFINGASVVGNITFSVIFPDNLVPVDLSSNMVWRPEIKTLLIAIDRVVSNQQLRVPIIVEGEPGTYQLRGQLFGQWTQIGQNFQSDVIVVETKIIKSGSYESFIEIIRANPRVVAVAKKIVLPSVVALEVAGGGSLLGAALSANASLAFQLAEILRFIGFAAFRWRRPKPWGKVYNQLTNLPIQGATVRIFEANFQKLKDTQFTDKDGRFGFLVSPGIYYLSVSRSGFQEVKTELINVGKSSESLNISIPLISESGIALKTKPLLNLLSALLKIIHRLNPIILAIGTLASIAIVVILPTVFNFAVLGIYLLLDVLRYFLARTTLKSFGQVMEKVTNRPLALAVVRLFDADKNWLLTSRVTDVAGRFQFLLVAGNYYATCAKEGYKSFTSKPLALARAGALTWDIILEPEH